jgi:hypothetical protein
MYDRLDFFVTLCLAFNVVVMVGTVYFIFEQPSGSRLQAFSAPLFYQTVVASTFYTAFLVGYTALGASVNYQLKLHRSFFCGSISMFYCVLDFQFCVFHRSSLSMQLLRVQERIQDLTRLLILSEQEQMNHNKLTTLDQDDQDDEENKFHDINKNLIHKSLTIDLLRLRGVQDGIRTCSDLVQSHNEYNPFRILNLNAQYTLSFSIASAFVSFIVTLASAYSSEKAL